MPTQTKPTPDEVAAARALIQEAENAELQDAIEGHRPVLPASYHRRGCPAAEDTSAVEAFDTDTIRDPGKPWDGKRGRIIRCVSCGADCLVVDGQVVKSS